MDTNNKKKRKGGAEKNREKKLKLLEAQASSCKSLKDIFKKKDDKSSPVTILSMNICTSNTSSSQFQKEITKKRADFEQIVCVEENSTKEPLLSCNLFELDTNLENKIIDTISSNTNDDLIKLENDLSEDYWFKPPKIEEITIFFKYHPIQINIANFNSEKLYKRKDKTCRKWVTYSKSQHLFFCLVCLAFHRQIENNFCKGVIDFKHMYQKLEEHEKSKTHSAAVESFVIQSKNADIKNFCVLKVLIFIKKKLWTDMQYYIELLMY